MIKKISKQKIESYQKFLEAFEKYSHKFILPEELKNIQNYKATQKYIFKCKNCNYENLKTPRDFINAYRKNLDIKCKGCEEGLNAINYKLKQLGLDKYIQIIDYKGTGKTKLKLTCKHNNTTYLFWSNFNDFISRNYKYYEKLNEWIFPNICDKCKREYLNKIKKQEWIEKFKNYETDTVKILWDESEYSDMYSKCVLYCKKHGKIETTWISIYNSEAKFLCRKCYLEELRKRSYKRRRLTVEKLQRILDSIHGARLIEILENPELKITGNDIIKVRCVKHNHIYHSYVNNLLRGHKCKFCGIENSSFKQTKYKTYDDLITDLQKQLPNDILDGFHIPSDVNKFPLKHNEYITVICNKHGAVKQNLQSIIKGNYCPYCTKTTSSLETEIIKFLRDILPKNIIIERNKKLLNNYEIDIYLPEFKLGIEIHGLYYHSLRPDNINEWSKLKTKHKIKADIADEKGIILLQIFENELKDQIKWNIWKSIIRAKLGLVETKYHARKLKIINLTEEKNLIKEFLTNNHLQGYIPYNYAYGLINPDTNEILQIITIGKSRFDNNSEYELLRFASKIDTIIIGGFNKLLKYVLNKHKIDNLITYADRRFTSKNKNIYKNSGFKFIGITKPNYYYFKPDDTNLKLYSRLKFQKYKLKDILEYYDESLTELENMILLNGYYTIYDAGNLKYELFS